MQDLEKKFEVSRRAVLAGIGSGLGSLGLGGILAPAQAAPVDPALGMGSAEWRQTYDNSVRSKGVRSEYPILSQATLQATEQAIAKYQELVARGALPRLNASERLRLGSRSQNVSILRQRLITLGDLEAGAGESPVFDSYVESAVKRFQLRHGLGNTGVVGPQTYAALNTPAETRLRQLEINAVRLRSFAHGNLGHKFVTANIPAAYVETQENGRVATRHAAGVGKVDRQSPIMNATLVEVNFNPFWTVPSSIIKKDLIPKMQKDPGYLRENKIRIFSGNNELQPEQVNWNSNEAMKYRFRQDPGGEFNSLGVVRINVISSHGVYMHDTPAKGIFGDDFRFVSSGCIRMQNIRDYVAWLLKDAPGWGRDQIEEAIRSGQRIDARFPAPMPVYWVYITAWATPEGAIQFRDDIYGRDGFGPGAVTQALQAKDDE